MLVTDWYVLNKLVDSMETRGNRIPARIVIVTMESFDVTWNSARSMESSAQRQVKADTRFWSVGLSVLQKLTF